MFNKIKAEETYDFESLEYLSLDYSDLVIKDYVISNESVVDSIRSVLTIDNINKAEKLKLFLINSIKLIRKWIDQTMFGITEMTNDLTKYVDSLPYDSVMEMPYDSKLVAFSRPVKHYSNSSISKNIKGVPGYYEFFSDSMRSLKNYIIPHILASKLSRYYAMSLADLGNGKLAILAVDDIGFIKGLTSNSFTSSEYAVVEHKRQTLKIYSNEIRLTFNRALVGDTKGLLDDIYNHSLLLPKEVDILTGVSKKSTHGETEQAKRLGLILISNRSKYTSQILTSQLRILHDAIYVMKKIDSLKWKKEHFSFVKDLTKRF